VTRSPFHRATLCGVLGALVFSSVARDDAHAAGVDDPGSARSAVDASVRLACEAARSIAAEAADGATQIEDGVFAEESLQHPVRGCRLVITGSFAHAPPGGDAASRLRDGFSARGWQELPAYSADGKDGTAFALRRNELACLFRGVWNGGSDGDPPIPAQDRYRVSVLCTSPPPPGQRHDAR
jgi:hypothetical protein